jgi:hypothetical protein
MGRWATLMLLGTTITLLHGCDVGGSSAVPTSFNPTTANDYSLAVLRSVQPGFARTFSVAGFDSGGAELRGTFAVQNLPATTFNGAPATPRLRTLALTDVSTNAFTTREEILYLATGFQVLGAAEPANGITCLPDAPFTALPAAAAIGESGVLGTLTCSDGNQRRLSWRMDSTTGGRALAVLITSINDGTGLALSMEEDRYIIDTAGDTHGVMIFLLDLTTGISTTLQSPVI